MKTQPTNLLEINQNLDFHLNAFVDDNWSNVPADFIERVSAFVDTFMVGRSFISGTAFSDAFINVDLSGLKSSSDNSDVMKKIKLFTKKQAMTLFIDEQNTLKNADFYDKHVKKIAKFLKTLKITDVMHPNDVQTSEYSGYFPKNPFFSFHGSIRNEYIKYRFSQSGVEYAETLARNILSYKLAVFADVQQTNLIRVAKNTETPKNETEMLEILEKTFII